MRPTETDSDDTSTDYDVLVIGGGPAGLSAALQLGRSLRSVLVCDDGDPRNGPAAEVHGYLTRDGIAPRELGRLGREEVADYGGEFRDRRVTTVTKDQHGFTSTLDGDETVTTRKVVLATGVTDELPETDGFEELWGNGVYHCPYCHGYEVRDGALGVLITDQHLIEYAKLISNLSEDLVVFTDGHDVLDADTRSAFADRGVEIEDEPIVALTGTGDGLESVSLADGREIPRDALFYPPAMTQRADLVEELGLEVTEAGLVEAERSGHGVGFTSIEGLFVAGDASALSALSVPAAAADGNVVGATVNMELSQEAFEHGEA
ncbi:NAD(P)/FAD-dependent oxidoreductase [Saliphagus infecundisoli]|uniref:NAD(P)/FAD-dependent oxidoreductase n=1 Tax=Saliphagus infecundisoli TaxID=1849069 RepID=A0ABD5QI87_9EURY|nr:NAD(P)/FAD-dependent oxidoreductase [Saliphagus infecundisoli]